MLTNSILINFNPKKQRALFTMEFTDLNMFTPIMKVQDFRSFTNPDLPLIEAKFNRPSQPVRSLLYNKTDLFYLDGLQVSMCR